jgi:hypothetical protein
MMQRILNSKNLVAFVLAAATGMTLYFRAPFHEGNTFLRVMALRSPSAFQVLKYSYTLFLFSTPFIGFSVVLSGLYVFVLKAKQRIRAGRLPLFPEPRKRDELFLVLGEVHNPRKLVPAECPQWLVIPERGLFTGGAILGAIGSGKTSCCIYPFAEQILAYRSGDKNANVADIYIGMNALQHHSSTRTKQDIEKISHVYLDIDHGGIASPEAIQSSDLVPRPNYVLNTSPEKYQVVWKVEGITIEEAEALNRAMVREFGGDPAATDSTRVLRLRRFATKKYATDFYVQARTESTHTYHLCDFKFQIDSQDAPRNQQEQSARRPLTQTNALSQSEHDWAYAKRALARGDDPEEVIRRVADYRAEEKHPNYARYTVEKARAALNSTRTDVQSQPEASDHSAPVRE